MGFYAWWILTGFLINTMGKRGNSSIQLWVPATKIVTNYHGFRMSAV